MSDQMSNDPFKPAPMMSNVRSDGWKYYYCSTPGTSFYRYDGKRLVFQWNVYATNIKGDMDYLDREIEEYQNPVLRYATDDEVATWKMMTNPGQAMREKVAGELVQDLATRVTPEVKQALLDALESSMSPADQETAFASSGIDPAQTDSADKLEGIDEKLKSLLSFRTSGGATVKLVPQSTSDLGPNKPLSGS